MRCIGSHFDLIVVNDFIYIWLIIAIRIIEIGQPDRDFLISNCSWLKRIDVAWQPIDSIIYPSLLHRPFTFFISVIVAKFERFAQITVCALLS